MARVSNTLAHTLNQNSANILGLIQSALDLPTTEVYDFALWLNSDSFLGDKSKQGGLSVGMSPAIEIRSPLAFQDYTENNQCMGYGLRSLG